MRLSYKAINKDGKTVRGYIDAKDKVEAVSYLRAKGFLPISMSDKGPGGITKYIPFLGKTGLSDVAFFTRQLSSMLSAGLTILQALSILKDQVQNENMKEAIASITTDIEEGNTFSQAISRHPDIFPPVYVSSIRASESGGLLDKVLLRLADNLEKEERLRATVKSALLYPAIVILGMIAVMVIMMVVVIPQLGTLYESLNVELPLSTRIIMGISNFTTTFWPVIIIILVGGIAFLNRWHNTETGKLVLDKWVLRIPVFSKLIQLSILTEFTRTLSLLIGSGTLVVEALQQTADITGNILYKNAIMGVSRRVEKGVTMSDALLAYPLFPSLLIQMVKIGEQTGKVDDSLMRASTYYEHELDTAVKNLTTALEPFILIVLGAGVAFLVFSIITPIYGIISQIG